MPSTSGETRELVEVRVRARVRVRVRVRVRDRIRVRVRVRVRVADLLRRSAAVRCCRPST